MVHFLLVNNALTYINLPKLLSENTCGVIGGCSSNGRALALHVRGTGIDPRQLHSFLLLTPLLYPFYPICMHQLHLSSQ